MLRDRRGVRPLQSGQPPAPSRVCTAEELAAEDAQKNKEAEEQAAAEREAKAAMEAKAREEAQLEELESGWISMAPDQKVETSVSAVSEAAMQEDRARLTFAEASAELAEAMRGPLARCSRAAVVIAAPTSGWGVIGNYMEIARDLGNLYKDGSGCPGGQTNMRVLILAGPRFDVLAKIQEEGTEL